MSSALRLKLYWRLSRDSRSALRKSKRGWGRPNYYNPQQRLINRLARETGWSWQKVTQELERERNLLLANPSAVVYQDFD
jgi:transposase